jgi:hypothetical protein
MSNVIYSANKQWCELFLSQKCSCASEENIKTFQVFLKERENYGLFEHKIFLNAPYTLHKIFLNAGYIFKFYGSLRIKETKTYGCDFKPG